MSHFPTTNLSIGCAKRLLLFAILELIVVPGIVRVYENHVLDVESGFCMLWIWNPSTRSQELLPIRAARSCLVWTVRLGL